MATVTIGGRSYEVEVRGDTVIVDGHEFPVSVREEAAYATVSAGGAPYRVQLPPQGERQSGMNVQVDYRPFTFEYEGRLGGPAPRARAAGGVAAAPPAAVGATKGGVQAQIAGRIMSVKVQPGNQVVRGDILLILEAMKMENEIKAPADGTVKEVLVKDGDRVVEGTVLIIIE